MRMIARTLVATKKEEIPLIFGDQTFFHTWEKQYPIGVSLCASFPVYFTETVKNEFLLRETVNCEDPEKYSLATALTRVLCFQLNLDRLFKSIKVVIEASLCGGDYLLSNDKSLIDSLPYDEINKFTQEHIGKKAPVFMSCLDFLLSK